jgi:hypothetical protein
VISKLDKENSACNAFEHMSVAGSGGDNFAGRAAAKTVIASTPAAAGIRGTPSKEGSSARSSADVRLGLFALLDKL